MNETQFKQAYLAQHANGDDPTTQEMNMMFDIAPSKMFTNMAPSYTHGVNPNFFEEFFAAGVDPEAGLAELTKTAECQALLWKEYSGRRWSYFGHLVGFHSNVTQTTWRQYSSKEFWRRFQSRSPIQGTPIDAWYFNPRRTLGDVVDMETVTYGSGYDKGLRASFANCPVSPKQSMSFGTVHVAVGFVDLGLLADSRILEAPEGSMTTSLRFHGFESNHFAVAKSLVLWEMMRTPGMKPAWVVQAWFSAVWSKRATNEFLAAAKRVWDNLSAKFHADLCTLFKLREVCALVQHWAQSKGVGLKKLIRRRSETRKESSNALFFSSKADRVEMISYHLTGAFGLGDEAPCSASVLMWDCPHDSHLDGGCVFHTLTVADVVSSKLYNGSYFQTAEKVKVARISLLMDHAQAGRIEVDLRVATLGLASEASFLVQQEIASLQPHSMSWSNIMDYMGAEQFHFVAKACGSTAVHSGYSMNWTKQVFGASLIDYPDTSLNVIDAANKATDGQMRALCGDRGIFLLPIQHNPLNTTSGYLASQCFSYWVEHYLGATNVLDAGMMESDCTGNPLSRTSTVVESSWNYE